MTEQSRYTTPAAFRRALTDRLRPLTLDGTWTLSQLQRQTAFDRLLTRLYQANGEWVIKGATALLARHIGVRGTLDIDLLLARARADVEVELRAAAATDIGDWFRFEIALARPVAAGTPGVRLPVTAYIGATVWSSFHVDLFGSDLKMTGTPDRVEPLVRIEMEGVSQGQYRVYPIVDHVAEKVVATFQRYGDRQMPSTRYKHLVDLVAISSVASVDAAELRTALESEADRRDVVIPVCFDVPDRALWSSGYAKAAREAKVTEGATLNDALALVTSFVDPVLDGTARGRWLPATRTWSAGVGGSR